MLCDTAESVAKSSFRQSRLCYKTYASIALDRYAHMRQMSMDCQLQYREIEIGNSEPFFLLKEILQQRHLNVEISSKKLLIKYLRQSFVLKSKRTLRTCEHFLLKLHAEHGVHESDFKAAIPACARRSGAACVAKRRGAPVSQVRRAVADRFSQLSGVHRACGPRVQGQHAGRSAER